LANYTVYERVRMNNARMNLGLLLKQQRLRIPLTLRELTDLSGVSSSHLGRIERGERFPSGSILRRIAKPLGFEEEELFTLAGYLSPISPDVAEPHPAYSGRQLDPYVAKVLAEEPVEVQRAVIGILSMLKSLAKSPTKENR
jgi:transcriptional regulator with XRE-family HTH domain